MKSSTSDTTPKRRHICFVVTARPSYARVRSAIQAAVAHPDLRVSIIGTASFLANRYGSAAQLMERDGLKLDWRISTLMDEDSITAAAKTTANQIAELATAFGNIQPDAVVTIADRYETMATAVAASYMNIPLVHLQGGEVTGNIDEKVRHAITKLADLHLASNENAQQRIIRLGEDPDRVHVTGCPSIDIAADIENRTMEIGNPFANFRGVGEPIDINEPFLVVLQHPVTTHYETSRHELSETLKAISELKLPVAWFWPNPDLGTSGAAEAIRSFREQSPKTNIAFVKNMDPEKFLATLVRSSCLVGNSSVGIRECAYLGVPVVNIGDRQRNRLRAANVIDADENSKSIETAIRKQLAHGPYSRSDIYGKGDAGKRVANLLASERLVFSKQITY